METTLQPGDRVMVNRLAYVAASPGTGDIVVFDAGIHVGHRAGGESDPINGALRWIGEVTGFGPSSAHTLIKRVIGTPGQTVECCTDDGQLMVDGEPIDEPYVTNDFPFDRRHARLHHHSAIGAVLRRGRRARPTRTSCSATTAATRRTPPRTAAATTGRRLLAVGDEARYRRQGRRAVLADHALERRCRPRRHVRKAPRRLFSVEHREAPMTTQTDHPHRRCRSRPPRPPARRARTAPQRTRARPDRASTRARPASARRATAPPSHRVCGCRGIRRRSPRRVRRAVAIEQAAEVIADAIDDETYVDHDIADGLMQLLEQRQRRQREIAPPVSGRSRWPTPDVRAPLR